MKIWVQRLRILHWGDSFINGLIDQEYILSLPDIYKLNWKDVAFYFGAGIAERAKQSLETSGNNIDFASFISALNIRMLDSHSKHMVAGGLDTVDKLLSADVDRLLRIEGIGETKAISIHTGLTKLSTVITRLDGLLTFAEKSGTMAGSSFCFTGSMSTPRKTLESLAIHAGGEIKKSVTNGLTYLVMSDPDSGSTKATKAQKIGTKCISEDKFLEMTRL